MQSKEINVYAITFTGNVNVSMTIFNQNIRGTVKWFLDSMFAKKMCRACAVVSKELGHGIYS